MYVDYVWKQLHHVDNFYKYKPTKTGEAKKITRTPTLTSSTSDEPTETRPGWLPPLRKDTMGGKNKRKYTKKTIKRKSRKNKKTIRTIK